jgi:hypothetical protein
MSDESKDLYARILLKSRWLGERASESAAKAAYIHEATETFTAAFSSIERNATGSNLQSTLTSGFVLGQELERELDGLLGKGQSFRDHVDLAIPIFSTTSAASVVSCNSIVSGSSFKFLPCPFLPDSAEQTYAEKLDLLDRSLGETYRSAWKEHYVLHSDSGRTALWQMRQVFDHLFELLGPSEAVRNSAYWERKKGDRPDAVHRKERLQYAANRWTPERMRVVLLESVEETLRAYQRLNIAHRRGELSKDRAREAFHGVDSVIRRWIDSVEPWPPTQ